ncbi:MAG: TerB family tellurite resistance protein [Flavobacteriales bacterium]|nr:TerB family tellurite resistance protein [Bacteroidota bacterium]MCB9240177.1 TerB family tellurite resistance protein [Flavobacteriales bacterium]
MERAKFNKDVAGYEMLLLLAESDGDFDPREGETIIDFIQQKFPLGGNLDAAIENISSLSKDDFMPRIDELAEDFYSDSSEEERKEFLQFALQLVRADEKLAKEENMLITRLFEAWDI